MPVASIYEVLRESLLAESPVALVTVIDGAHVGATLLIRPEQPPMGTLGDADLDRVAGRDALAELESGRTGVRHYGEQGQANETSVSLFVESFAPPPQMLIFGAVDFTAALGRVAKILGYRVTVCDAREVFATPKRFPMADEIVVDWPNRVFDRVGASLGPRDAVCILTHDPKFDVPAVLGALKSRAGYIGVMGSRKTHDKRLERLVDEGVDLDEFNARVMSPIGLDIGARSPEETAVSICAEIIARRTGRTPPSLPRPKRPDPLTPAGGSHARRRSRSDPRGRPSGLLEVRRRLLAPPRRGPRVPVGLLQRDGRGRMGRHRHPRGVGRRGRGITEAAAVLEEVAASGAAMNGCSARCTCRSSG